MTTSAANSTAHLQPLRCAIQDRPVTAPPSPWVKSAHYSIAGLLDVGFDREAELLLVVSSSGRGVFDCLTGEKIARDYTDNVFTDPYLECEGIGPLAGRLIRMSGISGGGLPVASSDGWSVETVALNWPDHHLLLVEPGSWLYGALCNWPWVFHTLAVERELRAFGFSWSGNSLVIATSSDLIVYRLRPAD